MLLIIVTITEKLMMTLWQIKYPNILTSTYSSILRHAYTLDHTLQCKENIETTISF